MGYYHEPPEDQPPGCLDVLALSRSMLGMVGLLLAVLLVAGGDIVATFVLFGIHPALALITIIPTVVAIWLYARWERRHFRPPGL
ncbi:MAG TPA: hypothetical protein VFY79_04015 [Dehalococcoidia bacterium]|nr:hypothetical protein [Dehalococcoidia bacterium]